MCVKSGSNLQIYLKRGLGLFLLSFKNGNFVGEQIGNETVDVELFPFLAFSDTGKKGRNYKKVHLLGYQLDYVLMVRRYTNRIVNGTCTARKSVEEPINAHVLTSATADVNAQFAVNLLEH